MSKSFAIVPIPALMCVIASIIAERPSPFSHAIIQPGAAGLARVASNSATRAGFARENDRNPRSYRFHARAFSQRCLPDGFKHALSRLTPCNSHTSDGYILVLDGGLSIFAEVCLHDMANEYAETPTIMRNIVQSLSWTVTRLTVHELTGTRLVRIGS
jgi:hypothetical protein